MVTKNPNWYKKKLTVPEEATVKMCFAKCLCVKVELFIFSVQVVRANREKLHFKTH